MNCCQCQGIEDLFNEKNVSRELTQYREKGPDGTTIMLVTALKKQGVQGLSLLDIGGGVGAIQHELLSAGAESAVDVDASQAYLKAAKSEAARRGLEERIHFQHGNFVDMAEQISPADIVTLDRVLCCYPDMNAMVDQSAARARKLYGLVYPRDDWWVKIGMVVLNFFFRLQKNPYRSFVHPSHMVEDLLSRYGFRRVYFQKTFIWQVIVYARV